MDTTKGRTEGYPKRDRRPSAKAVESEEQGKKKSLAS